MQESLLHHVWKYQKFSKHLLQSTSGASISVKSVGTYNTNSGPDFFNAQVVIGDQLWAGNVEIHVKSSDWYVHGHEKDNNYDNVILHVVWEHDIEVYRITNQPLTTLVLRPYVSETVIANYNALIFTRTNWINCEIQLPSINDFDLQNWLERLYVERLQQKTERIQQLLEASENDWENVLFKMISRNFGLNINGDALMSIAESLPYSVIRKHQHNANDLEALFFGQAGLLNSNVEEVYFCNLRERYQYLKHKYSLSVEGIIPVKFFRLRPSNFPTIRLSQLASLYAKRKHLFSSCMTANTLNDLYTIFEISASDFWKQHYTFNTKSRRSKKTLTRPFVNLLIINTVLPIKFCYEQYKGNMINDLSLDLIQQLPIEKNTIVDKFKSIKSVEKSALTSQGLLQLKNQYCDKNRCVQCAIGHQLIFKK